MPKARITRSSIDKLEYNGKQVEYFDTKLTGFGVRVNQTGKSYFVQCRVKDRKNHKGKQLEIKETIGRTDIVDYEKAYNKAKSIIDDAGEGITPDDIRAQKEDLEAEKINAAINEVRKDITLQQIFNEYIVTRKKLKASSVEAYQEDIDRYISDWKDSPIRSIDGNMIVARHSLIGRRSKARADGTMRVVRALFNHAMHMYDDIIFKNPVAKLSAVNAWYNVARKESYIKPNDLSKWLPAALQLGYDTSQDFLFLMLFQGSRKTETSELRWKDVKLDIGTAVFRETKTGIVLEVPLSRFIIDRLTERKKYYYNGPESFVFPSYGKTGHIVDARSALKVIQEATGVASSHHDLRRSFISYCEELEIGIFSRKRLANHAIPLDVTEGYTLFNMEKLRAVIEQIAAFILEHAEMPYQSKSIPPLSDDQLKTIVGSDFWNGLNGEQRTAFIEMMATGKDTAPNVISLEAARVRRRMAQ